MANNIITVGLGWGDEGKGATVDFLCRAYKSKTVIRYSGGHQCGHNVVTEDGRSHTFSQFGSGTLAGANTFLLRDVLIEPHALFNESVHLEKLGVNRPLDKLWVHPKCVVTTKYHRLFNRALSAIENNGTCGLGIGLTRFTALRGVSVYPNDDLDTIMDKLYQIRAILEDHYYSRDSENTAGLVDLLKTTEANHGLSVPRVAHNLHDALRRIQVSEPHYDDETVVFEGAQGMALNEYTGYNSKESTWGNVTIRNALEFLEEGGGSEKCHVLGIARCYATRHGGVLPWPEIHGFGDPGNPDNPYQGKIYAYRWNINYLEWCKATSCTDSVALNHLDHAQELGLDHTEVCRVRQLCDPVSVVGRGRSAVDRTIEKDRIVFNDLGLYDPV